MHHNLTDQIAAIQAENNKLKDFQKLLDKAMKIDLGLGRSEVLKMVTTQTKKTSNSISDFEKKLRNYFDLKTSHEIEDFLDIICSDAVLDFYRKNLEKSGENMTDEEQG